jgi:hypothetical protein
MQVSDEPRVRDLIKGLLSGFVSAVRENKLASTLAVFAGILGTFLAFTFQYDERPRYRAVILPDIQKAEANFTITLDNAEHAPSELWRLHYFLSAHTKIRDVLRVIRDRRPMTSDGVAAHNELIRYYRLVNEQMAIIRTEMSVNDDMDYWAEWKRQESQLRPIRASWLAWVNADSLGKPLPD